jgi:hypothetical protein
MDAQTCIVAFAISLPLILLPFKAVYALLLTTRDSNAGYGIQSLVLLLLG